MKYKNQQHNQKLYLNFPKISSLNTKHTKKNIPIAFNPVQAGFPSPADDFLEKGIDLNKFIIKNQASTFFVRAQGNSMIKSGIHSGDILVVDKSLDAKSKSIVIASIDGEFVVKKLIKKNNAIYLKPTNKNYETIKITKNEDFEIWGVVTFVIHQLN